MGVPVCELKLRIPPHEFAMWMAYDMLEPFGDWRADLRSAICTSGIVNAMVGAKTRPKDYMPEFQSVRKRQTVAEMKAAFSILAGRLRR